MTPTSPTQGSALIEARALTKRYRERAVLEALDWELAPGGARVLLGAPGQGKTTLLRLALGFVPPTAGEIRVLGQPARGMAPAVRRNIGYLPQRPSLPAELEVGRVLAAERARHRGWDVRLEERLRTVAGWREDRRVGQLARPQRRALELALALAPRPALCLLDEPFRDRELAGELAALVAELARAGGTTVLVASAPVPAAGALADEAWVLHAGRVAARVDLARRDGVRDVPAAFQAAIDAAAGGGS